MHNENVFNFFRIAKFEDCLKDEVINMDILKLLCMKGCCIIPTDASSQC